MTQLSNLQQSIGLLVWLLVCFAVSAIGAIGSFQAQSFYAELVQPDWAPPAWLFGPVWTTLYAMMAVAAWWVWRQGGLKAQRKVLGWFVIQLVLNALWSWLFFAWQCGGWAFAEVILLWLAIFITLTRFWRVSKLAGALLVPYLLWVSFAAALNFSLWQANPQLL